MRFLRSLTLKRKVLLLVAVTFLCTVVLVYGGSVMLLKRGLYDLEVKVTEGETDNLSRLLSRELTVLDTHVRDWAYWDDSYEFVLTKDEQYPLNNLADNTFVSLNVNTIAFFDTNLDFVFGKSYDFWEEQEVPVSWSLIEQVQDRSWPIDQPTEGLIDTEEGVMMVSAHPILDSRMMLSPRGIMLMGRLIDQREADRLAELTVLDFNINRYEQDVGGVRAVDSGTMEGFIVLDDIYGEPILVVQAFIPRLLNSQGTYYFRLFTYLLIIIGGALTMAIVWYLKRDVLHRLDMLCTEAEHVSTRPESSYRLRVYGNDELARVGEAFNGALERLEQAQNALLKREERLKRLTDHMLDVIIEVNGQMQVQYASPSAHKLLGYDKGEVEGTNVFRYIHPEDRRFVRKSVTKANPNTVTRFEFRCLHKRGEYVWLEGIGSLIPSEDANYIGVVTFRDISERRQAQQEIVHLSYYDQLTNTFNRAYFERVLGEMDQNADNLPMGVIMGDINGLKLANDAFGHSAGDELLQAVAQVLKDVVGTAGLVARWGGDEFAIVLTQTSVEAMEETCAEIKKACALTEFAGLRPSISLGTALKEEPKQKIATCLQEAEAKMYRHKLIESKSARTALISALQQTLDEKTHETKEHADRLRELSIKMGQKLGLGIVKLDELALLALLHDIGKVAIPTDILTKEGPLDAEEREVLKKHSEIGYRIALSSLELTPIAYGILSHHERWDGSGYPQGLRGEEIPLESRILAIVDAFDAMTNGRSAKQQEAAAQEDSSLQEEIGLQEESSLQEEALRQISLGSGTQFDPHLTEMFVSLFSPKTHGQRQG